MSRSDFFDVPTEPATTSAGPVDLPIRYWDATLVQAFFPCPLGRVAPLLEGTGLAPTPMAGGWGLAGVAFFEYRETSIGPYGEMAVGVACHPAAGPRPRLALLQLVAPPERRGVGFHLLDLPVTTGAACAAGRELWGYPKFVTPIDVRLCARELDCVVRHGDTGATLARLAGPVRHGPRIPGLDLLLLSNHGTSILRTVVRTHCRVRTTRGKGTVLDAGDTDHPLSRTLRALGLDGANPIAVQTCDRFRSLLYGGEVAAAWQAPPLKYGQEAAA